MAYRIENTIPNMTIMRMRAMHSNAFYKQDWYESEEFAHVPLPVGDYIIKGDPSAVELVWLLLHSPDSFLCYVWTLSYDSSGDQIYIGDPDDSKGIEIHRQLTITDKWIHLNG